MTVGEKNVNKINKTILLVGESGAGKSTLINVLLNYSMGVKFEDEVWFQIVEEEKKSETESQTSEVIVYEIFGFEDETLPYSLTIIDTPGFGGTRGIEYDDIISERLLDLFGSEDGVQEVHAVGLVMKATDNRLSDRPMYVLNSAMSLFEKDVEKNIIALITHANGRTPKSALKALEDAKVKCAKNEGKHRVYFLFDNCQHEDRTEEEEFLTGAYKISEKGMRDFTAFLKNSEPQKLQKTVEVLNKRHSLTACIQNLDKKIRLTEEKQTTIKQIQEDLTKYEEEMKKNEKFTEEVDEVYKDKEPLSGDRWKNIFQYAICCSHCETNCGYVKMSWLDKLLEVRKDDFCTVCGCPESAHSKEKWAYTSKTRRVKKTIEEMKEIFDGNKIARDSKLKILEKTKEEMKQLTAESSKLLREAYQHVLKLEQIALKADSVSTIVHLDFLIEKMKEEGDTEKVQKLEEMRSRVDEGTRAALRYKQYLENSLRSNEVGE